MNRQIVLPTSNIGREMMTCAQFLGFEIEQTSQSFDGNQRIHLLRDSSSFCFEQMGRESRSLRLPFIECHVNKEEADRLIDEISLNAQCTVRSITKQRFIVTELIGEHLSVRIIAPNYININKNR